SQQAPVFENSTHFKYSNFGFAVLGQVIEKVSGMSYQKYVTKNIFDKLGLSRTWADLTPDSMKYLAKGYGRVIPEETRKIFKHIATNSYAAATGLISNVPDLARFLSALSLKNEKGPQLISRESKKEMMRPNFWQADGDDFYGLGLDIWKIKDKKLVGHGGGFPGFITRVLLDPENDIGVVVLSNANESPATDVSDAAFKMILDLSADGKPDRKNLFKYEGLYRERWQDNIVVALHDGLRVFNPRTKSPINSGQQLKFIGKDKFIIEHDSSFGHAGEIVKFIFKKGIKKAQTMLWAGAPIQRVE
ncbi:beta-lactamase family protein, partial [Candidatus Uhrbacteria bacterium]|nr:beta-lactamase family protein [Candidatus Uhrbacteria bacterium]